MGNDFCVLPKRRAQKPEGESFVPATVRQRPESTEVALEPRRQQTFLASGQTIASKLPN